MATLTFARHSGAMLKGGILSGLDDGPLLEQLTGPQSSS